MGRRKSTSAKSISPIRTSSIREQHQGQEIAILYSQLSNVHKQLASFRKFVENINLKNPDQNDFTELQLRVSNVEPLYSKFNEIQIKLESLSEEIDEDAVEMFTEEYFKWLTKAKTLMSSTELNSVQNVSQQIKSQSLLSNQQNHLEVKAKLPILSVPIFSGNTENWLNFKDTFVSMIHNSSSLSAIEKFYYLKASLKNGALTVIENIPVTEANYKIAWDLIKDRFENKRILVSSHIQALLDLPSIQKESHTALRSLYDNLIQNMRALKSLEVPVDGWDSIIVHIVQNKFDFFTKRAFSEIKITGELPTYDDLINFIKSRCESLERLDASKIQTNSRSEKTWQPSNNQKLKGVIPQNKQQSYAIAVSDPCTNCNANHFLFQCPQFEKLPVKERLDLVTRHKLCKNCFKRGHMTSQCKSKHTCKKCNKYHHTMLHFDQPIPAVASTSQSNVTDYPREDQISTVNNYHSNREMSQVLLSTAVVKIIDSAGKIHFARCLLDSGSQSNFITQKLYNKLKLPSSKVNFAVAGINSSLLSIDHQTNVTIISTYTDFSINLSCLILPQITGQLPTNTFSSNLLKIPDDVKLADPSFNVSKDVDILIGASHFLNLLMIGQIRIPNSEAILQNTRLGWLVSGPLSLSYMTLSHFNQTMVSLHSASIINEEDILNQLQKFWQVEESQILPKSKLTQEEQFCEQHFLETVKRDVSGRFIVSFPLKKIISHLGESKQMAHKRYYSMEKRLCQNPEVEIQYKNFMLEYENLGHMSKLNHDLDVDEVAYYIPHHPIIKPSSLTTKLRVVFDASAKTTSNLSFNDCQLNGPVLQNDLFSIIVRFRQHAIVLTADIMKMYRQILIAPNQRHFQRIFWRHNSQDELSCYELNTVTYGTKSAPYLAIKCLMYLSEEFKSTFPKASSVLANDFYVDDLLTGGNTIEEVIQIQRHLTFILTTAGFELRKYLSNNSELLESIETNDAIEHTILSLGPNETTHTLGVIWNSTSDTIQYHIAVDTKERVTKRVILSSVSQIFDPLGLLAPIIVKGKLILQYLWQSKISWDDPVPREIYHEWSRFRSELVHLNNLQVPRFVLQLDIFSIELHGFSDASEKAYGACVFIRTVDLQGNTKVTLLCAKSRVAPLKKITLPRLELLAALLLAQLFDKLKNSLTISFNKIYFHCDSMIVLHWIKSSASKWQSFIANRISKIQHLTDVNQWYHVQSADNPADLITRGLSPEKLIESNLWWQGPPWLSENIITIENNKFDINSELEIPEIKKSRTATYTSQDQTESNEFLALVTRYSSLSKLQRVIAYCLRWKCKRKGAVKKGPLSPEELQKALFNFVRLAQIHSFKSEIYALEYNQFVSNKSTISSLHPFLDNNKLIRVGGRLRQSKYDYDKKHPILLPKNHPLTRLILTHKHKELLHCGPTQLLATIRDQFWPISGRCLAKDIVRKCIVCFKAKPKNTIQLMGDLPSGRINVSSPFTEVGVDYAGPFLLKDRKTRNPKVIKGYICLFICYATKAVHLELVTDLTTNNFLSCLRRFISRRGKPKIINSDNGTNFVGAQSELEKLSRFFNDNLTKNIIIDTMATEGIKWNFIPPRAPHFGGLWEAGIKSAKYHLKRVLRNEVLDYEAFNTVLIQIEAILNSRPLSPLTTDPTEFTPLTPAHFLIGKSLVALPDPNLQDVTRNRVDKFQKLQQLMQLYWTRWSHEYISELQRRLKWKSKISQFCRGDAMVLIKEDNLPPLCWKLGRIVEVHPGSDGLVRVVTIKTVSGLIKRAISRVCILPLDE